METGKATLWVTIDVERQAPVTTERNWRAGTVVALSLPCQSQEERIKAATPFAR